jgi:hypothetical protein
MSGVAQPYGLSDGFYLNFLPDPSTFEGAVLVTVVGGLILAVIIGGAVRLVRLRRRTPRPVPATTAAPETTPAPEHKPDVRILDLHSTGGAPDHVHFSAHVVNYGTRQCRATITARVGDEPVTCHPDSLDLIPNEPPQLVRVMVPRPELGELVPQFNHETTLYDKTLRIQAIADAHKETAEWHEVVYTHGENSQRHNIQQRYWRFGRDEGTDADYRNDQLEEMMRKREERYGGGSS